MDFWQLSHDKTINIDFSLHFFFSNITQYLVCQVHRCRNDEIAFLFHVVRKILVIQ